MNKALRTEDVDLLYTFRFFIGDLTKALQHEHEKILSSREEILTVYRGVKLDKEEFEKLKENRGKLISTNGYLSTSRLHRKALKFAMKPTKRTDVISVLFQINCHVKMIGKSIAFGDIAQFSEYPAEEEVLFDINACFEIDSIKEDGSIQVIKMNVSNEGETITKSFIEETQREVEEQSIVIVFGRLMCNLGEYDKAQKYFEELLNDPNDEDIAWIEFNIGRVLDFKGEWKEAKEYYDHAYERMMKSKPARMKDSAYVLNNIGVILHQQGKHAEALDCCQRALKMREKYYPSGHVNIASSLNNIGLILYSQGKYDEALRYQQHSLKMREKYYPSGHIDIASSLNNIGLLLYHQRRYDEALDYYQRALKMQWKYYPSGHVDIALGLNNIGACYECQNKTKIALEYYHRALTMYEKLLPVDHPDLVRTEENIQKLMNK